MPKRLKKMTTDAQAEIFAQPEAKNQADTAAARAETKRESVSAPKPARRGGKARPSPQRYLPGLSRRGRPRSTNPKPAVERALAHRQRRLEAGDKRVEVMLPAAALAALDSLCALWAEPRGAVIGRLLINEAQRLARRSGEKSAVAARRQMAPKAAGTR